MNFQIELEQYQDEDTFIKIPKSPKPIDGYVPKGKKPKKDYSKERERKRNSD